MPYPKPRVHDAENPMRAVVNNLNLSNKSAALSLAVRLACSCTVMLAMLALGCTRAVESDNERVATKPPEKNLLVEDLTLLMTSGTMTLREIRGAKATYYEDTRLLEATTVTLWLNLPDRNQALSARASGGSVYLAGKRIKPSREDRKGDAALEPLGYDGVQQWMSAPASSRSFGDIVLKGPVEGSTDDGGKFQTGAVLWSESQRRLLAPAPFQQSMRLPSGEYFDMSGSAFEADSSLRHWTYYSDNESFVLDWKPNRPAERN